ncbi:Protein of unknown function [Tranquillimonas rosea]|uniref:DUF3168 domain-containing protein n=1 Tax=Tranquillimonas rosea TaxID=641238 RepID=A0A1H9TDG1_9RHOB|nr:DUF3168 domain-containing protein [Tranquillimonas rosea]SER95136.1 Protein of unknown function [Tranquillimonas rosea]
MSYAMAGALQEAVYARLKADAALRAVVGDAVHDARPAGVLSGTFVLIGEERVREAGDMLSAGARHDLTISVESDAAGFATAKAAAAAVSDALTGAALTLGRGRLVGLWFRQARAQRLSPGDRRRIDLRFRARTDDE